MKKIKYEIEIPIHASPRMLYQYISSPSNLQEWFADKVNSRGKVYSFFLGRCRGDSGINYQNIGR